MSRILVTIITGFLGSGKTTLLNALLRHPDMSDAAVIINEFGEIGIDHDLVERSDENIIQLENGCLCCTVKGDLIDTFRDLYLRRKGGTIPWFDRVIIETTGIADPGPVLQIILTDPLITTGYQLDGVVTTLDAVNCHDTLQRFPESVKQVAVADKIVVTKSDLLDARDRQTLMAAIKARIRSLNPSAPIVVGSPGGIDPSELFGNGLTGPNSGELKDGVWLDPDAYQTDNAVSPEPPETTEKKTEDQSATLDFYRRYGHQVSEHHDHDPLIRTFCVVRDEPMTMDTLRLFLDGLAREAGPDLLRVKGVVNIVERPGHPGIIQGAQKVFHSLEWLKSWPTDDRRSRIVFITRGIDQSHIEETLDLIERIAARTRQAAQGAM